MLHYWLPFYTASDNIYLKIFTWSFLGDLQEVMDSFPDNRPLLTVELPIKGNSSYVMLVLVQSSGLDSKLYFSDSINAQFVVIQWHIGNLMSL